MSQYDPITPPKPIEARLDEIERRLEELLKKYDRICEIYVRGVEISEILDSVQAKDIDFLFARLDWVENHLFPGISPDLRTVRKIIGRGSGKAYDPLDYHKAKRVRLKEPRKTR